MNPKPNIKKNDQVLVITGKDRGARAKVLRMIPRQRKAIVERVNMIKKHTRPNPQQQVQGGILEREAPIHLSKLMVICPACDKPTRVGHNRHADGTSVRVRKKCGAERFS